MAPSSEAAVSDRQLDRHSFVPLYYQLQEVLKEQIESGVWRPGDALPSEPELARTFHVSRVVVRQALDYRAGGLSRLLASPRGSDVWIQVLDKRTASVERSIRKALAAEDEDIFRLTTLFSLRGVPLAIAYSFFRQSEADWLDRDSHVGRNMPAQLVLADHGVQLAHSRLSIETSQCGQFEADRFGIPHRSSVFLVLCTEFKVTDGGPRPFEVARVEYRGDLLQFRLEVSPDEAAALSATWTLTEDAPAAAALA